jgi:hypothetical protein
MCLPGYKPIVAVFRKTGARIDVAGAREADGRDGDLVERCVWIGNEPLLGDLLAGLTRVGAGADGVDEDVHLGFGDAEEAGRGWGLAAGVGGLVGWRKRRGGGGVG